MTPEQISNIKVLKTRNRVVCDPADGEIHKLDSVLYYADPLGGGDIGPRTIIATCKGYEILRHGNLEVLVNRQACPLANMQAAVDGPVG